MKRRAKNGKIADTKVVSLAELYDYERYASIKWNVYIEFQKKKKLDKLLDYVNDSSDDEGEIEIQEKSKEGTKDVAMKL